MSKKSSERRVFLYLGLFEDHVVFEYRNRSGDKPRYCTIHRPNPMDTIAELSVLKSFEEAQIDIPHWDVVWSD